MAENQHVLAISDESLMSVAYDEDTLSESERAHLRQCELCQQKLTLYKRTNALLRAKFYRFQCPSGVELNYYCLGMLSDDRRKSIDSHILDCLSCADEVQEIRQTQANFEAFPASTLASSTPHAIRRLIATYVVNQPTQLFSREDTSRVLREDAVVVLRDEAPRKGWPRQYQADSIDLSLHLSHTSSGEMMLIGIITSSNVTTKVSDFKGSKVHLYYTPGPLTEMSQSVETADPLLSTGIDGGGNFALEPLPVGSFVMLIRLPEQEILIGEFTVNQE
jgi:hypothetical protein